MISLENLNILTTLQKLPKNVGDLDFAQNPINRPIWSHCSWANPNVVYSFYIHVFQ